MEQESTVIMEQIRDIGSLEGASDQELVRLYKQQISRRIQFSE